MELIFIINALFIIGIHAITRRGMIFGFIENESGFMKPITECPTCMSSVWGIAGYFTLTALPWYGFPVWCICLAGFINLLTSLCWRD